MENNSYNPKAGINTNTNDIVNLRELINKYLKKWYWFVISVVICLSIALFYLKITNPEYEVQSTILLRKDPSNKKFSAEDFFEGIGMSGSKEVEDEILLLSSKSIVRDVIQELQIQNEYYIKRGFRFEEMYPEKSLKIITPIHFNDSILEPVVILIKKSEDSYKIEVDYQELEEKIELKDLTQNIKTIAGAFRFEILGNVSEGDEIKVVVYPIKSLIEMYSQKINVSASSKKSNGLRLTISTNCPIKGETLINKLVELYNLNAIIDKNILANNTSKFVEERLQIISDELRDVEVNMEGYKKENNITDIKTEAELFVLSSNEYNKKLSEVEVQISLVSFIENYMKDESNLYSFVPSSMSMDDKTDENIKVRGDLKQSRSREYNSVPLNIGIQDPNLSILIQEYNKALLARMKVQRTTNSSNPLALEMEGQLRAMRSNILGSIKSIKESLLISKRETLKKSNEYISKIKQIPNQERKFIEIKRQQEIKENLYLFLLKRREENALSLASTIPSARTVDAAYVSASPISPKPLIVLLTGFILGFIIPVGLIYVLDLFNDKIVDKKELQKLIKVPLLGSIGINRDEECIVVGEGKTTPVVEMFKLIRTNLQFMLGAKKSPVLLITSSVSGEGKSFTSINVAMTFALLKKKVVLVGLDVRNPMLSEYMHIPKNTGVTLYLSDPSYKLKDIIVPSGFHPSLSVIPAGPIPPNPAELLMSHRLDEMIEELKTEFDYIIIDSAPVGLVSDTFLLNRFVDNSLYLVRKGYTPKETTQFINELHQNNKLNNMAVVLNGASDSEGYGYSYGYGNKKKKSSIPSFKNFKTFFLG